MAGKTPPPRVAKTVRYSQSMLDVAPTKISDTIAHLVNSLLSSVISRGVTVDWTTLEVTTRACQEKGMWQTTASVEER